MCNNIRKLCYYKHKLLHADNTSVIAPSGRLHLPVLAFLEMTAAWNGEIEIAFVRELIG